MAKITVYRTDARTFEPGCSIASQGDHRNELPDEAKREAEDAIRAGQLNGERIRADSLYTYGSADLAQSDWQFRPKEAPRHLYELEIDEVDIVHVGDLQIYYAVIADIRAKRDAAHSVERYWTAHPSDKYKEYLVTTATVVKQLKNASEWKPAAQRAVEGLRDSTENEAFYKSVFKGPDQSQEPFR
jgi:hypothetical protein